VETKTYIKFLSYDDNELIQKILSRMLSVRGHTVFTSNSVAEAINFLKSNHIDLLITDYNMPRNTGLELINYVKENCPETKSFVMSSSCCNDLISRAKDTGANGFIIKPFTENEIFSSLEKISEI